MNSTGDSFGAGFDTRPDDALDLYAGGGPRIRLTADGKLGVGTTTITSAIIDNENYAYYVRAHGVEVGCISSPPLFCDWPSGIEFMGAVITYTTMEAD